MRRGSVRGRLVALLLSGVLAGGATIAASVPADAATGSTCDTAHAGPDRSGAPRGVGYFTPVVKAGKSRIERLLLTNPGTNDCTVLLAPAAGQTATNSGDTYVPVASKSACAGVACWVTGFPSSVIVPAKGRVVVPFTVAVPQGTAAGQYLAGVTATPAKGGAAPAAESQVQVRVTTRVAVGVAVRVPGTLAAHLTIPSVQIDTSHTPARNIEIVEANSGNTWEHPHGTFTARLGEKTVNLPVSSRTVLAGGHATLALAADTVAAGTYPSRVELQYGDNQVAVWTGELTFGPPAAVADASGTIVVTQTDPWAKAIMFIVLGVGLLIVVLLVMVLRRRRRDRPEAVPEPQ